MANYINSIVEKQKHIKARATRSDRKKSVRVWVDEWTYRKILHNSKLNFLSITAYCSAVVSNELEHNQFNYDEFDYGVEEHVVHIRLRQQDYERICELSSYFVYPSLRQTVHRVLLNGLKIEGG